MRTFSIMFAVVFFSACEIDDNTNGHYVDPSCLPRLDLVMAAVKTANQVLGEDSVVILGIAESNGVVNDDIASIICSDEDTENIAGLCYESGDIQLFENQITDDAHFVETLLHELGHYVAGNGDHVLPEDGGCVMTPYLTDERCVEYSDADIEMINEERSKK